MDFFPDAITGIFGGQKILIRSLSHELEELLGWLKRTLLSGVHFQPGLSN